MLSQEHSLHIPPSSAKLLFGGKWQWCKHFGNDVFPRPKWPGTISVFLAKGSLHQDQLGVPCGLWLQKFYRSHFYHNFFTQITASLHHQQYGGTHFWCTSEVTSPHWHKKGLGLLLLLISPPPANWLAPGEGPPKKGVSCPWQGPVNPE